VEEMRRLAKEHGLFVGPSSGAHLVAARQLRDRGFENVVTFFSDEGEKYLADYFTFYDEAQTVGLPHARPGSQSHKA